MTQWTGYDQLKPHVKASANIICAQFLVPSAGGWRASDPYPDHPSGLAVDYMVPLETGNLIKAFLHQHWDDHNVQYYIWQQRYHGSKTDVAGNLMEDRGSPTANHKDHVHVTYKPIGKAPDDTTGAQKLEDAVTAPLDYAKAVYDALTGVVNAFSFLTKPENWKRVAWFLLGVVLASIGLFKLDAPGMPKVASLAKKAVR